MATINEINDQLRPLLIQYRDSTRYGEYDFDRLRGSASLRKINELYDRLAEAKSVINAAAPLRILRWICLIRWRVESRIPTVTL